MSFQMQADGQFETEATGAAFVAQVQALFATLTVDELNHFSLNTVQSVTVEPLPSKNPQPPPAPDPKDAQIAQLQAQLDAATAQAADLANELAQAAPAKPAGP